MPEMKADGARLKSSNPGGSTKVLALGRKLRGAPLRCGRSWIFSFSTFRAVNVKLTFRPRRLRR